MKQVLITFILLIACNVPLAASQPSGEHIQEVTDLRVAAQQAHDQGLVLMLKFSSDYCYYCKRLEEDYLKPIQRNVDYQQKVLIRKVNLSSFIKVTNFDGRRMTPSQFAAQYDVFVTPTLVFVNRDGKEIAEKLVGLGTEGFFAAYIDQHISQARSKL